MTDLAGGLITGVGLVGFLLGIFAILSGVAAGSPVTLATGFALLIGALMAVGDGGSRA